MENATQHSALSTQHWSGAMTDSGIASEAAAARLAALEEGEVEEAVAQLRQAAALAPDDVAVRRELGEALAAMGDFAGAGAALAEAARLAPDDAEVLLDLAHVRQMGGDHAAARAAIERAAVLQ